MKDKKSEFRRFIDHLYTPDELESIEDIKDELKANSIDSDRVLKKTLALFHKSSEPKKPAWLESMREKHQKIEQKFSKQRESLKKRYGTPQELVAAIRSGAFGETYQKQANAYFRNQDFKTLSDKDLISFIEDCELLSILNGNDNE